MLQVRDLSIDHGLGPVVRAVGFDVAPGEVVAVLGASGSGKSSVLRAICGLLPAASGHVAWGDTPLDAVATHQRGIGMLVQGQALFPHLDVAGNIAFGLERAVRRRPHDAPRVVELLELVGLDGFAHRAVASLSGGEQQRVALARALAPRPRALLLDEPFGALDRALHRRLVRDVEAILRHTQVATVLVTHDHEEAFAMADRVAVLAEGHLAQCAAPDVLWSRPATEAVAALLGFGAAVDAVADVDGLHTPWGTIAGVAGPPTGRCRVVLRPDVAHLDEHGPVVGSVVRVAPGPLGPQADVDLGHGAVVPVRVDGPVGPTLRVRLRPDAVLVFGVRSEPGLSPA